MGDGSTIAKLNTNLLQCRLETLAETVTKLSGAVASASEISRALYLVTRFRSVNSISAFELYHSGDNMIAEADMVLPHSIPLKEAHDLGEVIVYCAESLSEIERVYVVSHFVLFFHVCFRDRALLAYCSCHLIQAPRLQSSRTGRSHWCERLIHSLALSSRIYLLCKYRVFSSSSETKG